MSAGPGMGGPPLPVLRSLEIKATPTGFAVAPRGPSADLWIEAVVWLFAFAGLGACVVFGGGALRAIGAVGIVAVGVRAVLRVVRATLGAVTRGLRILLRVPQPSLAGMVESVPLHDLAQLAVTQRAGLTGLLATTSSGAERWLVELDPANTEDYVALIAWVEQLCQRRLRP